MAGAAKVAAVAAKVRGHSVNILMREAAYGTVVGLVAAFGWHFAISKPYQTKINGFYAAHK
jgi:hypothetical protein